MIRQLGLSGNSLRRVLCYNLRPERPAGAAFGTQCGLHQPKKKDETAEKKPAKRQRRTKAQLQALVDQGINPKTGKRFRSAGTASKACDAPSAKATPDLPPPVSELPPKAQAKAKSDPLAHLHLPLPEHWPATFGKAAGKKGIRSFTQQSTFFVANQKTIGRIVDYMELGLRGSKTIIEAWSGPGTVTSQLIQHPGVEKVIAMEDDKAYVPWLESLKASQKPDIAEKLQLMQSSGFRWETYTDMFRLGHLDHLSSRLEIPATKGLSPEQVDLHGAALNPALHTSAKSHQDADWQADCDILFFAHLPNSVHGELLFAQLINAIASRAWLYQYGRVKLCFVCSESIMRRILAQPGDAMNRSKIGTTAQCLTDITWHIHGQELLPFKDHVYPPNGLVGLRVTATSALGIPNQNMSTGLGKQALSFVTLEPRRKPLISKELFEAFEYVTRKLFVLKAKPVSEALKTAAPGADDILNRLSRENPELAESEEEIIDPSTPVNCLTNDQWVALTRAFEIWPFRPQMLVEEGMLPDLEFKM